MHVNVRAGSAPRQKRQGERIEADCIEMLWALEQCKWLDQANAMLNYPDCEREALARTLFDMSLDTWIDRAMELAVDDLNCQLMSKGEEPGPESDQARQLQAMRRLLDELSAAECDSVLPIAAGPIGASISTGTC